MWFQFACLQEKGVLDQGKRSVGLCVGIQVKATPMLFINNSTTGRPRHCFKYWPNNKRLSFRIHRTCKSLVPGHAHTGHVKGSTNCMHKKAKHIQDRHSSYLYCNFICMKHIGDKILNKVSMFWNSNKHVSERKILNPRLNYQDKLPPIPHP